MYTDALVCNNIAYTIDHSPESPVSPPATQSLGMHYGGAKNAAPALCPLPPLRYAALPYALVATVCRTHRLQTAADNAQKQT